MPFQPTIEFGPKAELEDLILSLDILKNQYQRILFRTLARAKRDLVRIYLRELKKNIREDTRRRTGALLRVRPISRVIGGPNPFLRILPNFPETAYITTAGRGRRGASKRGQYAFVVNATPRNQPRRFIERTNEELRFNQDVVATLEKHLLFIIRSILERN